MKVDPDVLQKIFSTFGVTPLQSIKGANKIITSKVSQPVSGIAAVVLGNAGFTFSFDDNSYKNESSYANDEQSIFAIPHPQHGTVYLWVWGGVMARLLLGDDKLVKWLAGDNKYPNGKVNDFMSTYLNMSGQKESMFDKNKSNEDPADSIDNEESPEGPVPDRSDVGKPLSKADQIIQGLLRKAKIKPGTKLSKQPPIRLPADDIIDLYHKAKEIQINDPDGSQKLMSFIKTIRPLEENIIKKVQFKTLISEIVNEIVKEVNEGAIRRPQGSENWYSGDFSSNEVPSDETWVVNMANKIWKDSQDLRHGRSSWRLRNSKKAKSGEMVYQLSKDIHFTDTRFIINRDGKWYYLDIQKPGHEKKWKELPESPPVKEMTMTAAVSPVSTPKAFKPKTKEEALNEMNTTDGGTTGYNVPGAFSRKGGSKAGLDGSAALGYTLTPIGKKDMELKADKLH